MSDLLREREGIRSDTETVPHRIPRQINVHEPIGRKRLAGMAKARPGHDRKRHRADRPDRPGMNAAADRDDLRKDDRAGDERESDWHEGIADMEDQDESVEEAATPAIGIPEHW